MLPDCLTDGADVVSDLEQEEMKILREVLRYAFSTVFKWNVSSVVYDLNVFELFPRKYYRQNDFFGGGHVYTAWVSDSYLNA